MDAAMTDRCHIRAASRLGGLSTPRNIVNAAPYLSSEEASMPTGVVLEIDGGR